MKVFDAAYKLLDKMHHDNASLHFLIKNEFQKVIDLVS